MKPVRSADLTNAEAARRSRHAADTADSSVRDRHLREAARHYCVGMNDRQAAHGWNKLARYKEFA